MLLLSAALHLPFTPQTVKRVSLELGGNAPFIVFDDADLELAATGVVQSALRNSGQTCICANRVFVQDKVGISIAQHSAACHTAAQRQRKTLQAMALQLC